MKNPTQTTISLNEFTVVIDNEKPRGWFDGEVTGELIFEREGSLLRLVDYDGVYELPTTVFKILDNEGVLMDEEFAPYSYKEGLLDAVVVDEVESIMSSDPYEIMKAVRVGVYAKYEGATYDELRELAKERESD